MARWIGAAPRYAGNSDACRFTASPPIASINSGESFCPKAMTTDASAPAPRTRRTNASPLTSSPRHTGSPASSAHAATGVGVITRFRPAGRSGCRHHRRHPVSLVQRRECGQAEGTGAEEEQSHGE